MRPGPHVHRVLSVRPVSEAAFVLRFTRDALAFTPGQWLNLGLPRRRAQREYSIYSGAGDDFLEVLVKEIPGGALTPLLRGLRPGDELTVDGPRGSFTLPGGDGSSAAPARCLFCATGTGISPFHSMARSIPGLDFLLLHGVRSAAERYDAGQWEPARVVHCVSGAPAGPGEFPGRLTAWLRGHAGQDAHAGRDCYLCGNSDMVYEAWAILAGAGVPRERIHTEVYF